MAGRRGSETTPEVLLARLPMFDAEIASMQSWLDEQQPPEVFAPPPRVQRARRSVQPAASAAVSAAAPATAATASQDAAKSGKQRRVRIQALEIPGDGDAALDTDAEAAASAATATPGMDGTASGPGLPTPSHLQVPTSPLNKLARIVHLDEALRSPNKPPPTRSLSPLKFSAVVAGLLSPSASGVAAAREPQPSKRRPPQPTPRPEPLQLEAMRRMRQLYTEALVEERCVQAPAPMPSRYAARLSAVRAIIRRDVEPARQAVADVAARCNDVAAQLASAKQGFRRRLLADLHAKLMLKLVFLALRAHKVEASAARRVTSRASEAAARAAVATAWQRWWEHHQRARGVAVLQRRRLQRAWQHWDALMQQRLVLLERMHRAALYHDTVLRHRVFCIWRVWTEQHAGVTRRGALLQRQVSQQRQRRLWLLWRQRFSRRVQRAEAEVFDVRRVQRSVLRRWSLALLHADDCARADALAARLTARHAWHRWQCELRVQQTGALLARATSAQRMRRAWTAWSEQCHASSVFRAVARVRAHARARCLRSALLAWCQYVQLRRLLRTALSCRRRHLLGFAWRQWRGVSRVVVPSSQLFSPSSATASSIAITDDETAGRGVDADADSGDADIGHLLQPSAGVDEQSLWSSPHRQNDSRLNDGDGDGDDDTVLLADTPAREPAELVVVPGTPARSDSPVLHRDTPVHASVTKTLRATSATSVLLAETPARSSPQLYSAHVDLAVTPRSAARTRRSSAVAPSTALSSPAATSRALRYAVGTRARSSPRLTTAAESPSRDILADTPARSSPRLDTAAAESPSRVILADTPARSSPRLDTAAAESPSRVILADTPARLSLDTSTRVSSAGQSRVLQRDTQARSSVSARASHSAVLADTPARSSPRLDASAVALSSARTSRTDTSRAVLAATPARSSPRLRSTPSAHQRRSDADAVAVDAAVRRRLMEDLDHVSSSDDDARRGDGVADQHVAVPASDDSAVQADEMPPVSAPSSLASMTDNAATQLPSDIGGVNVSSSSAGGVAPIPVLTTSPPQAAAPGRQQGRARRPRRHRDRSSADRTAVVASAADAAIAHAHQLLDDLRRRELQLLRDAVPPGERDDAREAWYRQYVESRPVLPSPRGPQRIERQVVRANLPSNVFHRLYAQRRVADVDVAPHHAPRGGAVSRTDTQVGAADQLAAMLDQLAGDRQRAQELERDVEARAAVRGRVSLPTARSVLADVLQAQSSSRLRARRGRPNKLHRAGITRGSAAAGPSVLRKPASLAATPASTQHSMVVSVLPTALGAATSASMQPITVAPLTATTTTTSTGSASTTATQGAPSVLRKNALLAAKPASMQQSTVATTTAIAAARATAATTATTKTTTSTTRSTATTPATTATTKTTTSTTRSTATTPATPATPATATPGARPSLRAQRPAHRGRLRLMRHGGNTRSPATSTQPRGNVDADVPALLSVSDDEGCDDNALPAAIDLDAVLPLPRVGASMEAVSRKNKDRARETPRPRAISATTQTAADPVAEPSTESMDESFQEMMASLSQVSRVLDQVSPPPRHVDIVSAQKAPEMLHQLSASLRDALNSLQHAGATADASTNSDDDPMAGRLCDAATSPVATVNTADVACSAAAPSATSSASSSLSSSSLSSPVQVQRRVSFALPAGASDSLVPAGVLDAVYGSVQRAASTLSGLNSLATSVELLLQQRARGAPAIPSDEAVAVMRRLALAKHRLSVESRAWRAWRSALLHLQTARRVHRQRLLHRSLRRWHAAWQRGRGIAFLRAWHGLVVARAADLAMHALYWRREVPLRAVFTLWRRWVVQRQRERRVHHDSMLAAWRHWRCWHTQAPRLRRRLLLHATMRRWHAHWRAIASVRDRDASLTAVVHLRRRQRWFRHWHAVFRARLLLLRRAFHAWRAATIQGMQMQLLERRADAFRQQRAAVARERERFPSLSSSSDLSSVVLTAADADAAWVRAVCLCALQRWHELAQHRGKIRRLRQAADQFARRRVLTQLFRVWQRRLGLVPQLQRRWLAGADIPRMSRHARPASTKKRKKKTTTTGSTSKRSSKAAGNNQRYQRRRLKMGSVR